MSDALFDLSSFQRDLLYVIVGKTDPSGQDIKEELQREMGEITHGRLYPNLDTLVKQGYVEKGQSDRRTNYYRANEKAMASIRARRQWEDRYVEL